MEERARGNVTQYFINKQAYKIIFHHGKQNASDLHPSIYNNARCSWAIGSTWNMLTHYQIFRNRVWPSQQVLKLPGKEGIHHFFHTFLRVLGAASKTTIRNWIVGQLDVFTWRHGRHVGVANPSRGSWTFFLCKNVLFFPICVAAGHVGKTLYTKTLRTVTTSPYYF